MSPLARTLTSLTDVLALADPRYEKPLLIATTLKLGPQTLHRLYSDRWPVEQLPLAGKQMVGAHRQFVFAAESCQRLPELVLLAGSMSLGDIVAAQAIPFLLVQPLALFVFITGMSAELNRTPFDVAEAESEIIAGYHTEYSGIKFALIFAAEAGGMLVVSAVIATLFLSGWSGPLASFVGWLWLLFKTFLVIFVFIWVRATYPRLRLDQIMALSWKFLLPLSLINLAATSLEVFFLRGESGVLTAADLWIMAGINIPLALGSIALFGNLVREKVRVVPARPVTPTVPGIPTIGVR